VRRLAVLFLSMWGGLGVGDTSVASPCLAPPVAAVVVDRFRPPGCAWCPGNRGLEYATRPGTTVRAAAAGRVEFSGSVAGTLYVVVRHRTGLRTTYGSLAARAVAVGEWVQRGSRVGTAGSTLFFGVRLGDRYLDPQRYLVQRVRRPRLVPVAGRPRPPGRPDRFTCTAALARR
jgi:murein DD-endopeptidase MepM/ murein hydrolase activator NlpD